MSSEVVPTTTYSCPNCHVALDAPAGAWDGWLRCPSCGRASLPPEPARAYIGRAAQVSGHENGAPARGRLARAMARASRSSAPHTGRMAHTSPARLIFTTGFVLCLLLTLIVFPRLQTPGKWQSSGS